MITPKERLVIWLFGPLIEYLHSKNIFFGIVCLLPLALMLIPTIVRHGRLRKWRDLDIRDKGWVFGFFFAVLGAVMIQIFMFQDAHRSH